MDNSRGRSQKVAVKRRVVSRDIKRRTYIVLVVFLCFVFVLLNVVSRESQFTETSKAISFHQANLANTQNQSFDRDALKLRLRELKMHNALRFVEAERNNQVPSVTQHSSEKIELDASLQAQLIEQKVLQWEANFLHPY
jgi:hypothetical protein